MALDKVPSGFDTRIGNTPVATIVWDAICGTSVTDYNKALNVVLSVYAGSTATHGNESFAQTALWYRLDGGTWTQVTGVTAVAMALNGALTDNDPVGDSAGCQTTVSDEEWTTATGGTFNFTYSGLAEAQFGLDISAVGDNVLIEFSLDNGVVALDASITTAAGSATYSIQKASNLRILATIQIQKASNLRILATQQIQKASNLRITVQSEIQKSSNLRILATSQIQKASNERIKVLGTQIQKSSNLRIVVSTQIQKASNLRIKALGIQIQKASNLRIKIIDIQIQKASNLRILATYQIIKSSNLTISLGSPQIVKSSNLRIKVFDNQIVKGSNLRVVVTDQIIKPTNLRIKALDIQIQKASNLRIKVVGIQIQKSSNLRISVTSQIIKSSNLSIVVSLEGIRKIRPSNLRIKVLDIQIIKASNLRIVLTSQLVKTSNLRILATQQIQKASNLRVKVLDIQIIKSSNLRITVGAVQFIKASNLRIKVLGVQIQKPSNLRIKIVGTQIVKASNLRIALQLQITKSSNLRVRVFDQQIIKASNLRVITLSGLRIIKPSSLRVKGTQQIIKSSNLRIEIPSLFTIQIDDTDVGVVRKLMAQAGREAIRVHADDILYTFVSGTSYHIYTDFQDIMDVGGIWLVTDLDHSGTNYLEGSTVYHKEGKIELAQSLPEGTDEILITYATRDGLDDETIQLNVDMAKTYLQGELWQQVLDYSGSSTYSEMAKWTMYSVAQYWCILTINSSNAIQSGYNYRIAEFEIQTKLWGEGMIAETLLNKYWERAMKMIKALKIFESNPEAPLYVVDRSNSRVPYNRDPTIFHTMTSMEAVTLKDSRSQYAIIMKIWG